MGTPEVMFVIRWFHFLAGITWIGLLYYLNLVNVRFVPNIPAEVRPQIVPLNLGRVLAWFRHSAWVTVLMGFLLLYLVYWQRGDVVTSNGAKTIFIGMILGSIMAINVWFIIWPNQKRILNAMGTVGTANPITADPAWGRNALYASRANFTMSFPMLLFMAGSSHYPLDWSGIVILGLIAAAIGAFVWNYVQRMNPTAF
ncbi:MAG TPA: urate hydroxylase PuuD [Chloroflexota bacterium]|jgi:uncharacterized membrane protein